MTATGPATKQTNTTDHPDHSVQAHVPATVALTLLTVVTAISLCRVFPDWVYLRPMLVVCIGVHAAMCVLRAAKAPAWVALPAGLFAAVVLVSLIYFRDSTRFGIPTGETIDQFRVAMRLVWQQFPRAVAPVPSEGGFAIAATSALAVCAWLADSFAFRAFGRAEAVVPAGVVFIFTSALGVSRNRVLVAALWVGAAILVIAALRMAHARDDSAWMGKRRQSLWSALPAAITCALFATTGAVAVAPQLPGAGEKPLIDTRHREGDIAELVSPMTDLRSKLVNKGNVELLTVATETPRYLALSALANFDGRHWLTVAGEELRPADGALADPPPDAELITQLVTIKKLRGKLAPAASTPLAVNWLSDRTVQWVDRSRALFVQDGLTPGMRYETTSADADPTPDQLRSSTASNPPDPIFYQLPDSLPQEIYDLAEAVTAQATTPYDQARALQDWLRTFEYSTTVQAGHSNDAMLNFLSIKKGYCEQFSGTFAAMARALNLPARVVIGFTPGILRGDGVYHIAGRHAHAWSEVWFDDYGWVLFDPTPGRGAPGAEGHTGAQPAQQEGEGAAGNGQSVEDAPTPTFTPPAVLRDRELERGQSGSSVPRNTAIRSQPRSSSRDGLIILALTLAILAWVVAMPRAVNRWARRRTKGPVERVTAAWAATVRSLTMAGAPRISGRTPLEYARAVDVGRAEAVEIARLVTRAVYSPRGVDDGAAERSELLRTEVDAVCRTRMSLATRLLDHLDPRSAFRRIAG